jgi:hypothetical protein
MRKSLIITVFVFWSILVFIDIYLTNSLNKNKECIDNFLIEQKKTEETIKIQQKQIEDLIEYQDRMVEAIKSNRKNIEENINADITILKMMQK